MSDDIDQGGIHDLHPIELTAHTLLSGSLDNLHENFELLNQSQYILLTRLRLIEERLSSIKTVFVDSENHVDEKEVQNTFNKLKELRKSLHSSLKTLAQVNNRVERMSSTINIED